METKIEIKNVSDTQLLQKTRDLVHEEKRITLAILHCFIAIEDRLLYAQQSYPSMFEYLVRALGYSEGQAQRRMSAARLLRQVPQAEAQVREGSLKISQLAQVQTFLRAEKKLSQRHYVQSEKLEILSELVGKSTRETERVLLQKSPALQEARLTETRTREVSPDLTQVTLTLDHEGMVLLQEARELSAHNREMDPPLSELIKNGLRLLIAKKKKSKGLVGQTDCDVPAGVGVGSVTEGDAPVLAASEVRCSVPITKKHRTRYLSRNDTREVSARARRQCEFVSRDGLRCESRYAMEFHHVRPWARGGQNSAQNLAYFCRAHNAYQARVDFGQ